MWRTGLAESILRITQKILKVQYNMTANIKVEKLLDYCHQNGKKFYASLIYLVSKTVNSIDNFKMFQDKEGNLCIWDHVVPNYTIFSRRR